MPLKITNVTPPRFRALDLITVQGLGFAPASLGVNTVLIDGEEAVIQSQSETAITVEVPSGIAEDVFVAVQVQRTDTFDADASPWFSKASSADMGSQAAEPPGAVPGADEASALTLSIQDTFQAQDYERLVTYLQFLLFHVLTTVGDLYAHSGAGFMQRFAKGSAGQVLRADTTQALGLLWSTAPARRVHHSYGKKILANNSNNGVMVANGNADATSLLYGQHGAGQAGTLDRVVVRVLEFTAGDTLDRVRILQNGVNVHDSGTGLGLTTFYAASPAIVVVATDLLQLEATKAGTNGIMRLRGSLSLA